MNTEKSYILQDIKGKLWKINTKHIGNHQDYAFGEFTKIDKPPEWDKKE